jgi:hypothetical protein
MFCHSKLATILGKSSYMTSLNKMSGSYMWQNNISLSLAVVQWTSLPTGQDQCTAYANASLSAFACQVRTFFICEDPRFICFKVVSMNITMSLIVIKVQAPSKQVNNFFIFNRVATKYIPIFSCRAQHQWHLLLFFQRNSQL